jgi:hypothetical protein
MGHWAGANAERGVFRTQDGGKTWKKVSTRATRPAPSTSQIDPPTPRSSTPAIYQFLRQPWNFDSGGPDSGLWKSTDGGDTWKEITRNPGLPKGPLGRIGITVSPAKPDSVWAIVEAAEGGIFHSDDGGATWTEVNNVNDIKQRAWYYSRIFADPKNADTMYAVNTSFYKVHRRRPHLQGHSDRHGDNHDLWIAAKKIPTA